ncbi:MAG: hypothetical protein ABI678_14510 [Kofleriaceae bacterium]
MSDRDDAIGELSDDEQQLVAQLRALPGEGREPDWAQLEREIHLAVGPQVPLPWWRRMRWLLPIGALGALAVIVVILLGHREPAHVAVVAHDAAVVTPVVETAKPDTAVWLDGQAVEVGEGVDPSVLIYDDIEDGDAIAGTGLLPADDLRWVDTLDDGALDRAEHWLEKKGHAKG